MKRIVWFLFAGGIGFIIDAGLTHVLISNAELNPFFARIPAIMAAMAATFVINRSRTFGRSPHSLMKEGFRYWVVGITSAVLNYAVYSLLMREIPTLQPLIAVICGSAAATFYSFFGYSRFVFRHHNRNRQDG